jgi:hypothetical protein
LFIFSFIVYRSFFRLSFIVHQLDYRLTTESYAALRRCDVSDSEKLRLPYKPNSRLKSSLLIGFSFSASLIASENICLSADEKALSSIYTVDMEKAGSTLNLTASWQIPDKGGIPAFLLF